MRGWAALAIVCGCGRISFDPLGASDGGETTCMRWGMWRTGELILVGTMLADPTETADRTELRFTQGLDLGPYTLGVATRVDVAVPYGAPLDDNTLDVSTASDTEPAITDDGLSIMFSSDRSGSNRAYEATRATAQLGFSPPALALGLEGLVVVGTGTGGSISISRDGLVAYVPLAATLQRFTRATRTSTFVFDQDYGVVAPYPSMGRDELELYYNCFTGICRRTRSSTAASFGPEEQVDFGMTVADADLSTDGSSIVFASNGSLYRSTRTCAD